jgi:FkbM family methyltransferase
LGTVARPTIGVERALTAGALRRWPLGLRGRDRLFAYADRTYGTAEPMLAPMHLGYEMMLDLRSRTESQAYYSGHYESELIRAACRLIRPGGTAIDVGANIGFWSVPLAQRALSIGAEVVAFEPLVANAERLKQNLAINSVVADVHTVALSDRNGESTITLREDFARGAVTGNAAITIDDGQDDVWASEQIALTRLDDVGLDSRIDVIKVDVEGHEDHFLRGARKTLERDAPVLFVEWNPSYFDRRGIEASAVVEEALLGLDYLCFRRERNQWTTTDRFFSPRRLDDLVLASSNDHHRVLRALRGGGEPPDS